MIVKILGIIDIVVGIFFWISGFFEIIPQNFMTVLGMIVIIKGVIFLCGWNVASILDIASGIIIFLSFQIKIPEILIISVSIYLIQKGVLSILMSS